MKSGSLTTTESSSLETSMTSLLPTIKETGTQFTEPGIKSLWIMAPNLLVTLLGQRELILHGAAQEWMQEATLPNSNLISIRTSSI
jgi:hypothetical protein